MSDEEFHWQTYLTNRNIESRNWLLEHYLYLVRATRIRMRIKCQDWEDVEQEGMLALLTAIEHYDPTHKVQFRTYAILCIRRKFMSLVERWARCASHQDPTPAEEINVPERLTILKEMSNPEEQILKSECCRFVREKVQCLKPKTRDVVIDHFWHDKTLTSIAKEQRLSVPGVFLRKKRGLNKLRMMIPADLFGKY